MYTEPRSCAGCGRFLCLGTVTNKEIYSDSSGVQGRPPCRRCVELSQECVIGHSRRGGRRVKGVKMSKAAASVGQSTLPVEPGQNVDMNMDQWRAGSRSGRVIGGSQSDEAVATTDGLDDPSTTRPSPEVHWRHTASDRSWEQMEDGRQDLEGHFASTDLLNPADALHLLAQVADLESDEQPDSESSAGRGATATSHAQGSGAARTDTHQFPPISDGHLTLSDASYLIKQYVSPTLCLSIPY